MLDELVILYVAYVDNFTFFKHRTGVRARARRQTDGRVFVLDRTTGQSGPNVQMRARATPTSANNLIHSTNISPARTPIFEWAASKSDWFDGAPDEFIP